MNSAFKKPEDSPGFLLWQLSNYWQRQQRKALAKLGLTHAQFVVLAAVLWLSTLPNNTVTQNQVSEFAQIDKMSMSHLVLTLLRKKMLERRSHPKDKRAYALDLTKKGRAIVLKAMPLVEGVDAQFFSTKSENLMLFLYNLRHLIL